MTESTEATPSGTTSPVGACSGNASADVDCREALRDLYGYLDGEMTAEQREHIRIHIEECGPCLDAFDFEMELRRLVAKTCQQEAPEDLRARVAEAIRTFDSDPTGTGAA